MLHGIPMINEMTFCSIPQDLTFNYTARFKKAWKQLNEEEKALARKAITNLAMNVRYPALRARKIKGTVGIWEARVSRSLRLTFQIDGDTIILRNIGHHDETLERP